MAIVPNRSSFFQSISNHPELIVVVNDELAYENIVITIKKYGCAVVSNIIQSDALSKTQARLFPVMDAIRKGYDFERDKVLLNNRQWGVVRQPPVGVGKTNVHFDPFNSDIHSAMQALAVEGKFEMILSKYSGGTVQLSECGLSVTRPGGDGMEWHADGLRGEMTVLMAIEDVDATLGQVGVIPCSHEAYDDCDREHFEDTIRQIVENHTPVFYAYRAGSPLMIDARTLHSVMDNQSQSFRFVFWWIFNRDSTDDETI